MIYVPDTENYECFVVNSDTTIRAYKEIPTNNSSIDYRDYYYTSNYLYKDGTQNFSNYTTLPVCLDNSKITTNYFYRNDFPDILIMFFILAIVLIYFPFRIFSRAFGRWLRI